MHPTQVKLLDLIAQGIFTIREFQEQIGVPSTSMIAYHLNQLEKKGYLKIYRKKGKKAVTYKINKNSETLDLFLLQTISQIFKKNDINNILNLYKDQWLHCSFHLKINELESDIKLFQLEECDNPDLRNCRTYNLDTKK